MDIRMYTPAKGLCLLEDIRYNSNANKSVLYKFKHCLKMP